MAAEPVETAVSGASAEPSQAAELVILLLPDDKKARRARFFGRWQRKSKRSS